MSDNSHQISGPVASHNRAPLLAGTRLDHYVIRDVIGSGGFAITYLAEHEVLGKRYAIKEYFPAAISYRHGVTVQPTESSISTYNWGLDRFTTEARSLARFKHPSIVDVTSIFEANGTAYIVLAFEQGRSLAQWIRETTRPPTQAELDQIVRPLLGALEEIHKHNVMHRDIAPDNIIMRDDGSPVLIDFGAAREAVHGQSRAISTIVKHGYSPPEQYSSRPELLGPWTDIYALASTLYRLVTGRMPPQSPDRMLKDELVPITGLALGHYRQSFLEAIDWGLRLRAADRPQSAGEWRRLLMRDEPLKAPVPQPRDAPSDPQSHVTTSARAQQGTRGRNSLRPDISVIESLDTDERESAEAPQAMATGTRVAGMTVLGLAAGAIGGALFSILPASILSSGCFADSCVLSYLPACSLLGALIGGYAGYRIGRYPPEEPGPGGA